MLEVREFARASALTPIVEPANLGFPSGLIQPCRLRFPLDHYHVTKHRDEPWVLAEPLVGLDIGSLLEPAVQDVVARGHVGLIKVGGTWVRAEPSKPNPETGHGRGPHFRKESW